MDFSGWLVHILLLSPFFSTWFSEYHTLSIVTSSFIKLSILEYFIDKIFTFDRIWGFTDKTTKSTFGPVLQDNTVLLIGIGPNCEVILELCVDGWLVMGFLSVWPWAALIIYCSVYKITYMILFGGRFVKSLWFVYNK